MSLFYKPVASTSRYTPDVTSRREDPKRRRSSVGAHQRIVAPGDGTSQAFMPGELFIWKTTGPSNGGAIDFGELALEPEVRVPEHIHHAHDEAYYILDGRYRFKVGDEVAEAIAGAFVFIPRGTPHAWSNIGGAAGRVAVIFTPGSMAGYFHELEPLIPDLMVGIPDMSKVDPAVLAQAQMIMNRYQYELVGPPLT
jgi:quercetin dioxygenase-like cupin family protein